MTEKKPAKKQPAKKVPEKKTPAKKPTAKTPAKKTPTKTSNNTPAKKRGRPPKTAITSAAPTQPEIVINVTTKHSTNHIKNFILNTYHKLVKTNQKRG